MKVFIWQCIDHATEASSHHTEGGLVVFAEDLDRARIIANENPGTILGENEAPDEVREVIGGGEGVYVFQDIGCC